MPLRQHWGGGHDLPNPGWARLQFTGHVLVVETVFLGPRPRNRARRLNEATHRLGDVAEIFLHARGTGNYYELHVTPENQRLQLRWPIPETSHGARSRSGTTPFVIDDPNWVESDTRVAEHGWSSRAVIPCRHLEAGVPGPPAHQWLAAVCRYDWSLGTDAVLSSTAPLTAPFFHRWPEWHALDFVASPRCHDGRTADAI